MKNYISKIKPSVWIALIISLLYPFTSALKSYAAKNPEWVEKSYSEGIYVPIVSSLGKLTGQVSFSVAEILLVAGAAVLVFAVAVFAKRAFLSIKNGVVSAKKATASALTFLLYCFSIFSAVNFVFLLLWGLNYYRSPLSELFGYDTENIKAEEIIAICEDLSERAGEQRTKLKEENGFVKFELEQNEIFDKAPACFTDALEKFSFIKTTPKRPKPVRLSFLMSYAGISGVYTALTAEANVNRDVTAYTVPSTACHELAHQLGFAKEDDANFLSYLACTTSGDEEFEYSGTMLALAYSLNALYQTDKDIYKEIYGRLDEGVRRDFASNREFWEKYDGFVSEVSDNINDRYLKNNGQKHGVLSYRNMVNLLVGHYRKNVF